MRRILWVPDPEPQGLGAELRSAKASFPLPVQERNIQGCFLVNWQSNVVFCKALWLFKGPRKY